MKKEAGGGQRRGGREKMHVYLIVQWQKGLNCTEEKSINRSGALTTDSAGKLHVLGHDGNSLGVDGAEVSVLEETDHVGFGGLLEGKDGGGLETELVSVLRGDLTDESLEGELSDEELGGLLETSDLTESDGTGSESVGFLDTVGGGLGLLGSSLVSDVLSWVLGAGVLAGSLLGAGHCFYFLLLILKHSMLVLKLLPLISVISLVLFEFWAKSALKEGFLTTSAKASDFLF